MRPDVSPEQLLGMVESADRPEDRSSWTRSLVARLKHRRPQSEPCAQPMATADRLVAAYSATSTSWERSQLAQHAAGLFGSVRGASRRFYEGALANEIFDGPRSKIRSKLARLQ
jgi:hypothetical protein